MTVSELEVLTSHASNVCKSLVDHFSALSEEGKKEYKAWIRQHRGSTVINSITDLADIINDVFDKVEN